MSYPKVTLWVPAAEDPRGWSEVMTWWNMKTPGNQRMKLVPGKTSLNNVKVTWNKIVKDFLASDADILFSVHNDVIADPDTLMRLLSWKKPLVSALIFMRQSPVIPHIWASYNNTHIQPYAIRMKDTYNWFMKHESAIRFGPHVMKPRPRNALQEIDFTSTSCCVIHRSVFEAMRERVQDVWFKWDNEEGGGEDRNFFENARAVGYPAYVDRSCIVGHAVGEIPTSSADFMAWSYTSDFQNTGEPEPG